MLAAVDRRGGEWSMERRPWHEHYPEGIPPALDYEELTVVVDGRDVHRIKVLTQQGRVRRLQVDARSGRRVPPGR